MGLQARSVALAVLLFVVWTAAESESVPKAPITFALLGNLKIEVSKVEQVELIADSLTGPSSSRHFGRVYVTIRNVGDFLVCAALTPSIEEYQSSELQYTQRLKTGFAHNPQIKNLAPGAEASGYYGFKPSPQKRDYVFVLQERNGTQRCEKPSKAEDAASSPPTARLPL